MSAVMYEDMPVPAGWLLVNRAGFDSNGESLVLRIADIQQLGVTRHDGAYLTYIVTDGQTILVLQTLEEVLKAMIRSEGCRCCR